MASSAGSFARRSAHIVGTGLAGLSAAITLYRTGYTNIHLYEATNHAGGRARSFYDCGLKHQIDNGNHLILSANHALMEYVEQIGATARLCGPDQAHFTFVDLNQKKCWALRPNKGPIPWWLFAPTRRVPGAGSLAHLKGLRLLWAGPEASVATCLDSNSPLYHTLWEPLTLAILNAPPQEASAQLMGQVLRETLARGGHYCRPLLARQGLSNSLVDPALAMLAKGGIHPHFGHRLRKLKIKDGRITLLDFASRSIPIDADATVILALPAKVTAELLPSALTLMPTGHAIKNKSQTPPQIPHDSHAIINAHFLCDHSLSTNLTHGKISPELGLIGAVGTIAHWLFIRDRLISVTISAADSLTKQPAQTLATLLWPEIVQILSLCGIETLKPTPLPPYRIIKEKNATFRQTPQAVRNRPGTRTKLANLLLAGDWTATGLPATMEGAIRSGKAACTALLTS